MIEISKNMKVEGFTNKKDFDLWIKKQERHEPNENILKTFKWYLMQVEDGVNNCIYNQKHIDALDKYAVKMIDRKIMSEDNVIKFIGMIKDWRNK